MLGWFIAIGVTFWTSNHPWLGFGCVMLSMVWGVFLFWPELNRLRIVYPKGSVVESPRWLYAFGIVGALMVGLSFANLYLSTMRLPEMLSDTELSQAVYAR
jgi:hypothetical protein